MIFKRTGLKPIETTHGQRRHAMSRCRSRGFTLIVTLSLMILITLIAVGLLTLSSVSLRGATQTQAQATARANARLAIYMRPCFYKLFYML
jgi:Tfp pilus assembly protein PilX